MTLLSRFAGLARDVLIVRIFGDTPIGSAFAAAFAIPNTFRRLFGEGALSAAFLPEYSRADKASPEQARVFAGVVLAALGLVTVSITVLIELALLALLALGEHGAERSLSLRLIMVMLPFMPFICTTAILGGMLQVHGRFGPAASGPIILNGFMIAVGVWHLVSGSGAGATTAYVLGVATVLSGVTQAVWFLTLLPGRIARPRLTPQVRERAGRTLRTFVPVLVGLGTLQLSGLMDMLIAMWPIWVGPTVLGAAYPLDGASNAILASAQKLYQFPLGVFGIAVAAAVFPMLSRAADESERFERILRRGLRLSFFIGLPASVGLILVRHDVTRTLFAGGGSGFSADGVERATAVVAGFAPAVWAYSVNHVLTRAYYARGDTSTPMRVAIGAVGFNLLLNLVLMWPLREAGLAAATALSATAQTVVLSWLCGRTLGVRPLADGVGRAAGRILLAAGVMAGAVIACGWGVRAAAGGALTPWSLAACTLAAKTVVGAVAYASTCRALGVPELGWLVHRSVAPSGGREEGL
jgi:putative peptidoglycan lipid II flippase